MGVMTSRCKGKTNNLVTSRHLNKEGKAGIMIRLSLNGEISQFSSKLDIEPDKWDTALGKAKGNTLKARQLNETLEDIRTSLKNHLSGSISSFELN